MVVHQSSVSATIGECGALRYASTSSRSESSFPKFPAGLGRVGERGLLADEPYDRATIRGTPYGPWVIEIGRGRSVAGRHRCVVAWCRDAGLRKSRPCTPPFPAQAERGDSCAGSPWAGAARRWAWAGSRSRSCDSSHRNSARWRISVWGLPSQIPRSSVWAMVVRGV
jgi:hypothetical protein